MRLEQLLRERIANNTAFQVKMAAIRLGCSQASGKSRAGGGTDQPEQVDGDIEVRRAATYVPMSTCVCHFFRSL